MALLALAAMVGLTAPLAHASDEVASYVVQADIAADGVLTVNATITPDRAGAELRQRFATSVTTARDLRYQFTIGDVRATVLDLAVRGHLLITELPRAGAFKPTEWTLTRREGRDALRAYEARLLDALGGDGGDGARSVVLSQALPALAEASGEVQDELYADVVRHGWFAVRPDSTRTKWVRLGWLAIAVAVVAAGLLIAFTEFGLLGLVLVALAVGVGFVGQAMPARTIKGASVLQGLGVLRGQLLTQPTDQMPRGREYQELSEVLPYAVVLGGVDRWLDGLAATDTDGVPDPTDLDWYHGPDDWQLADLPDSLRNFVQTTEGGLLKR